MVVLLTSFISILTRAGPCGICTLLPSDFLCSMQRSLVCSLWAARRRRLSSDFRIGKAVMAVFRLFSRFRTFIWVNWHSHSHTSQISTNDFQTSRPTPRCCGGCKASTSRVCGKNLPSWRVTKIYWKFTWIPRFHALMHWFLTERCEKKSPREGCVRIHPAATITSHAAAPTFLWLSDKLAACWMILSA